MKIEVDKVDVRIDKYLSLVTGYSRELITKMINDEFVLVNERCVKPSYKVKLNDVIYLDDSYKIEQDIKPQKIDLEILYEDDDIMVINKPSGLVVHPGNGNSDNTLVNALMYHSNELSDLGGSERVGIVHRLDKDTSGLMLACKTNKSHEILSDDFKNKRVTREYYALLIGEFKTDTAFIDAPIGRSKTNFNKMEVTENGKSARTHLKVIKRYKGYTLVSLILETGRTHQIRVHFKYINHPVYGDPLYARETEGTKYGQFLHAGIIGYNDPKTGEYREFSYPIPDYFKEELERLRRSKK